MTATVAIVVEGVLRRETDEGTIPQGVRLYHGLAHTYKVALLTALSVDDTTRWLKINGFTEHVYLLGTALHADDDAAERMAQIRVLQRAGCAVDLLIEPDPHIAAVALDNGITVLPLMHPRYSRPYFRPDATTELSPWRELVGKVERQRELRARDARPEQEIL